jgi:hypothetical protein
MPHLDDEHLSLAERIRSPKFGDSYGYGRYAEGILQHGQLSKPDGTPILKHMPALPLLLALVFKTFGSVRPFLAFQILFLFLTLYLFLARVRGAFPAIAVMATPVVLAVHPSTIKHSSGVMTDLLFGSMLMWAAFLLWKREPGSKEFAAVGIVFGLAAYLRESAFPFMLMTGLAYLLNDRKKYQRRVGVMACVFLMLLLPWALRNQFLTHKFTPLTTKTSDLFYYYSIPLTTDVYAPFGAGFQEQGYDYAKLYEIYDREAHRWSNGQTEPAERGATLKETYDAWLDRPLPLNPIKEGLKNYYSRPQEQVYSLLLKTVALFNKPAVLAQLAPSSLSTLLVVGNVVFYTFHVGVILLGVALSFTTRHNRFIFLPYWITGQYVQSLLFWSEERYLMPFYPFLVLMALSWYWTQWQPGRLPRACRFAASHRPPSQQVSGPARTGRADGSTDQERVPPSPARAWSVPKPDGCWLLSRVDPVND